jgi:hypothetical protein
MDSDSFSTKRSENCFTLVVNAGRSGSTHLAHLLQRNYGDECFVMHEDIPVYITKPRLHNRAYSAEQFQSVMNDARLSARLSEWETKLADKPIIETGWTAYHLCPVLSRLFRDRFRVIVLHRDPVSFAFSRANMGNYHPKTFYGPDHEVSPFDNRSIVPEYQSLWSTMNHFEKCMFWWFTVYKEADEFRAKHPDVPCLELSSSRLFSGEQLEEIISFAGLNPEMLMHREAPKNELPVFMRETFPVRDEWRPYRRHTAILEFAESLGYQFDGDAIEALARKYELPDRFISKLRHRTTFWRIRSGIAKRVKAVLRKFAL